MRVDPSKNQVGFYACYKTKLIFAVYKNQVDFCKQATKTKLIFSMQASYKNQVNF